MRKSTKIIAITSVVVAALAAAPTLYAEDSQPPSGSMMGHGMMGGMTGMTSMGRMMDHCNQMMQSGGSGSRPNDQWRKNAPTNPRKDG